MMISNLFEHLPEDLSLEVFESIVESDKVRIERIVSKGHSSPADFWYDQDKNEWVLLLKGRAEIRFLEDNKSVVLNSGDYLNIPAHVKHRVDSTPPNEETIWLAVFY